MYRKFKFLSVAFILVAALSLPGCLSAPESEPDPTSNSSSTKSASISIVETSDLQSGRGGITATKDGDYTFSTLRLEQSTTATLTLINTGDLPADKILAYALTSPLSYYGGSYPGTGGTCQKKIFSQQTCTIVISFSPLKSGTNSATLKLGYFNGKSTRTFEKVFSGKGESLPTITSIYPNAGTLLGGETITITGTQLFAGASVTVGGKGCTVTSSVEPATILCTLPSHTEGSVDVVVRNIDGQIITASQGYSYRLPPVISAISPSWGSQGGGNTVTLTGSRFYSGAIVLIGGEICSSVNVQSSTQLTCTTPSHFVGVNDVRIINTEAQEYTLAGSFTFVPAPTVTGVTPATGALAGGTEITISGTGFITGASVSVGGVACNPINVVSSSSLICTTGAHSQGTVSIVVTNSDSQSGTGTNIFTYTPAPTVTAVLPTAGALAGGTSITVTGTGFLTGATVLVDGNACSSVNVVSANSITCSTPAGTAGAKSIIVTNTDTQTGTGVSLYTYQAAPAVTSASPSAGALSGGTSITLTGTGFITGATVTIGGTACTSPSVASLTSMSCTLPASTAGAKNIIVTNSDTQTGTLAGGYTYQPAPTVTNVSPTGGSTLGGSAITITGTGFVSGATVTVGGVACTSPSVVSSTSLTCTTGVHAAGVTSIIVTNSDGQSGTGSNLYTFRPPPTVTSISVTTGSTLGGTYFTITGTGFISGATVAIGGNSCNFVSFVSATSLSCFAPAHTAGIKDLVVTNTDNQTGTLSNAFTYSTDSVPSTTGFYGRTVFRVKGAYAAVPTCTANGVSVTVTDKGSSWYQLSGLTADTVYNVTCSSPAGSGRVTAKTLASSETFMNQGDLTYSSTSLTAEHCLKWSRKIIYNNATGDIIIGGSGSTGSFTGGGYSCLFVYTGYHWYPILLGQDTSTSGHGYQTGNGLVALSDGTVFATSETWDATLGWNIRVSKCTSSCHLSANWQSIIITDGNSGIGSSLSVSQDESKLVITRTTNFAVHLCNLSTGCSSTTNWTNVYFGVGAGNAQGSTHFDVNGGMWVAAPSFNSSFLWYCPSSSLCTSSTDYTYGKLIGTQTGEVTGFGNGMFNSGNNIEFLGTEKVTSKWLSAECDPTQVDCSVLTSGVFSNFTTTEVALPTGLSGDGYTSGPWFGILSSGFSLIYLDSSNSNRVSRKICTGNLNTCRSVAAANWTGGVANWGNKKVSSKSDITANFTKGSFVDDNDEQVMIGGGWDSLKTGVLSYFD